jgi:hypothetical protein
MPKRYRLLAKAQMHGEVREPGYVFTLGDGEIGPHRTVVASSHGAQIVDHISMDQKLEDHPLYVEIDDDGKEIGADSVKLIEHKIDPKA